MQHDFFQPSGVLYIDRLVQPQLLFQGCSGCRVARGIGWYERIDSIPREGVHDGKDKDGQQEPHWHELQDAVQSVFQHVGILSLGYVSIYAVRTPPPW